MRSWAPRAVGLIHQTPQDAAGFCGCAGSRHAAFWMRCRRLQRVLTFSWPALLPHPADATAYKELIPTWKALGVKVVQVHSGSEKKYVQVRQAWGAAAGAGHDAVGKLPACPVLSKQA